MSLSLLIVEHTNLLLLHPNLNHNRRSSFCYLI